MALLVTGTTIGKTGELTEMTIINPLAGRWWTHPAISRDVFGL
jgi:hypothetical protein